jgi:DNA-binding transcriptional regulator YiaG
MYGRCRGPATGAKETRGGGDIEVDSELAQVLSRGRTLRRLPEPAIRRLLRERANVTQYALAGYLGVTQPTLSRWESGEWLPRGEMLNRYVDVLEELAAEAVR